MVLLFALFGCTQDPMEHPDLVARSDGRVQLVVKAPGSVHVGEPIDLELEVSLGPGKGSMAFDITENSPPGRVRSDTWVVRPQAGQRDAGVFWEDRGARLMPVPGRLETDPLTLRVALNDWARFDRPGRYAVQLHTTRASGEVVISASVPLVVTGRDASSDAARLDALIARIDAGEGVERALAEIRWLGVRDTIPLAVERIGVGGSARIRKGWMLVLATHPDTAAVAAAVLAAIAAPEQPIRNELLEAGAAVTYAQTYTRPIGPAPSKGSDPILLAFRAAAAERAATWEQALDIHRLALLDVLPTKTGAAQGVSLGAIAESLVTSPQPPAWTDRGWKEVREGFATLPLPRRRSLVQHNWDRVRDVSVAPGIAAMIAEPLVSVEERDGLLVSLVGLDEAVAAPILERLISDPKRGIGPIGLTALLSVASISESAGDGLVDRMDEAADRGQQLALIGTYSGVTHADELWKRYLAEPGDVSSEVLAGYAAYYLRHDDARSSVILDRSGPDRPHLLLKIAPLVSDRSELVRRALIGLDSRSQAVMFKSSDVICEYATEAVVPELLARVPRTKEDWQEGLVTALMTARGYTLDEDTRIAVLKQLSDERSDAVIRSTHGSDIAGTVIPISIREGQAVVTINYREYVGVDAIQAKLSQFEKTAVFRPKWVKITPEEGLALLKPALDAVEASFYEPSR